MKNAVHKRLDKLTEVWINFTQDDSLRVYRFLVDNENSDLITGFISYHQEDESGLADLLLHFEKSFQDPQTYGRSLRAELIENYQHEEFQEMMNTGGVNAGWNPPKLNRERSDYGHFAFCCKSFYEYHKKDMENLVIILTPELITSQEEWISWLSDLLDISYSPRIRFILLDNAESPILEELVVKLGSKVFSDRPKVDLPNILEQLAAEGDLNDLGVQFRQSFIAIGNAAEIKDEEKIRREAQKAIKIVDQKEWFPLKVALYMTLGGSYLALGNKEEALSHYKVAREAANLSDVRGDIEGKQLVIHSAMAEASALISMDRFGDAALIYQQNGDSISQNPVSEDQPTNTRLTLENYRMASYCYFVDKKREIAWEQGLRALKVGELMDETTKKSSTLPYVGQGLLAIAEKKPYKEKQEWIHEQMTALMKEDWKEFWEERTGDKKKGGIRV